MRHPDEIPLMLELVVAGALPGCAYALQLRASELDQVQVGDGTDLLFRVPLTIRPGREGGLAPRGPAVQGRGEDRFVYICSGSMAGQTASPWTRRMKVPLRGIVDLLPAARADSLPTLLKGRVRGTAKDGGPACASVKMLDGWALASRASTAERAPDDRW